MSNMMISAFGAAAACDPWWSKVALLAHCAGTDGSTTFVDSSVTNATLTSNGATVSTAQSKFGGTSGYFNGTGTTTAGTNLTTPTSSVYSFGLQDFTVEAWVRLAQTPAAAAVIIDGRPAGTNGAYFDLAVNTSRQLELYVSSAVRITSSALSLDQWYHVAVSRNGGTTRLFVDGVQSGSSWADGTNYLQDRFVIGSSGYHTGPSSQYGLNGWLDDVRITVSAGRYPSQFPVPTAASYETQCGWYFGGESVYLCSGLNDNDVVADGRRVDGFTHTKRSPVGAAINLMTNTVFGYRSRSAGTGGYIRWNDATIEDSYWTNSAGWTVDIWFYTSGGSGGYLWCVRDTPTANEKGPKQILHKLEIVADGGNRFLQYSQSLEAYASTGSTGSYTNVTSATTLTANAWHHARVCCKNGEIRLYQDGAEVGTRITFRNTAPGSRNKFQLMSSDSTSTGDTFTGFIDSFCLFTRGFHMDLTGLPTQEYDGLSRFNEWLAQKNCKVTSSERKLIQNSGSAELLGRGHAMMPVSGKWYWEMEVGSSGSFLLAAGLGNTEDSNMVVAGRSGGTAFNSLTGATTGTMASFTAGRLQFAFDADARKLWMGRNGAWFSSGNPASGTNPYFSTIPRANLYPVCHGDNNGSNHYATLCMTSATCNYTPPSGFYHLCEEWEPSFDRYSSSVVSLLNMGGSNGSTTFTDASGRTWTAAGNAQISTTLGYNAALFDGTGDYVTTPYVQADFDWWTGDFTIEAWVYATSWTNWSYVDGTTRPALLGCADPATTTNYWSFGPSLGGGLLFTYYNGAAQSIVHGSAIPTSTLSHIAFCKEGTGMYLAINGDVQYKNTVSGTPQSSPTSPVKLVLGMINNRSIDGYVKAVRITKGVSRYASAFVPSAAPFPTA